MFLILLFSIITSAPSVERPVPWLPGEHRALADSALRIVLRELGSDAPTFPSASDPSLSIATNIWEGLNFGRLTERFARNDGASSRFQEAGQTVYQQLGGTTRAEIESFWALASNRSDRSGPQAPSKPGAQNVIANFLLSHLAALQYAHVAASAQQPDQDALRWMLVYESIAQGLLADAHASGHLLVPRHDPFQSLHPINNRHAHDYYGSDGVFVVNGRYEAWEAFGDGLLTWYAQSYRQVLAASVSSLREVFLVYYAGRGTVPEPLRRWVESMTDRPVNDVVDDWLEWKNGDAYYETYTGMPSLSFIPMPVSATWSVRGESRDERHIRVRRHYPQLRELGYHDQDLLDVLKSRLYARDAFPPRFIPREMIPGAAGTTLPAETAESNRDVASVEFVQVQRLQPDFAGLLIEGGAGVLVDDENSTPALSARIGYGLAEDVLVASHLSVNAGVTVPLEDDRVTPATIVAGLNPGGLPLRVEIGYATTTDDFLSESALALAGAWDLTSNVLGLTYVGFSIRLRYGVMFFDDVIHSASIQIAFY